MLFFISLGFPVFSEGPMDLPTNLEMLDLLELA